ncbi:MAG TPA: GNAT family N-acetyltransferase [Euzebyales bacterium]|nr:GNAT family N-acetyltransferase [Euzebyales bacterium]
MTAGTQIRPLRPEDTEQVFHLRVAAFSGEARVDYDPDEIYIPDEHRLVAVDGARVVGHLGVWPFGQAFGGRAVPAGGVAAVVVADDRRGTGVGSRLLAAGLEHMGRVGMAISTLYPSTPAPYRRWGWEVAGVNVRRRVATRDLLDIPAPSGQLALRPYTPADLAAVVAVHDALALAEHGGLVAGERWLRRALEPDPDEPDITIVATREDQPVGLVQAAKTPPEDDHSSFGLRVRRLFGVDRDVERALWRFIGHHHPIAAMTSFRSRPAEPLLFELPYGMHLPAPASEHFMTRLVDVPAAIAARGWPAVSVTVELDIVDQRRPAASGRHVLEVTDGAGVMKPGGAGGIAVDIGAFSSLYTGFATAAQLAHAGRLAGASGDDIAALTEIFAAPLPYLTEYF